MSKIIAVNAGSSSLKFQLFEMPSEKVLTSGVVERIGLNDSIFTIKVNGEKITTVTDIKDHVVAVNMLLNALVEHKIVSSLDEIDGVGHRVVHGGELYNKSVVMDDEVAKNIKELSSLAPLHNPANLVGYESFKKALPHAGHVAVFDTAFHQTMSEETFLYPIPYEYYKEYKVRKYGFHGTSHKYVSSKMNEKLSGPSKKVITCHLGNGASLAAVKDGSCINTSMGFTPLAGIMMGTRSGDVDPSIITYLMEKTGKTAQEIIDIYNKKSGMLGISGISSDARDIEHAIEENVPSAILTRKIYVNRIIQTIGSYFAQMGGVDAIVFTGGVGENDTDTRAAICDKLAEAFGVDYDHELNAKTRGKEVRISTDNSKVQVWVIPTNEELVIAKDTCSLLGL